ncbi:MerR family transcriptional regulator [Amycolatopsis sp. NPDC059657]|uniref:MerR family transcriptional regulator n=1 Tax=Amycolatopsis sp. NPDC059657 TaxID=3346899 RepID=UPI003672AE09
MVSSHGYTIEELSSAIGMSVRNIRAHQTRGLLPAPAKSGRFALYGPVHMRRLEQIASLQKQGFNLVSIAAMLGAGQEPQETGAACPEVMRAAIDMAAAGIPLPTALRFLAQAMDSVIPVAQAMADAHAERVPVPYSEEDFAELLVSAFRVVVANRPENRIRPRAAAG